MTTTTKRACWYDVMAELRGARLALYDELLCNGDAVLGNEQAQAAATWLRAHQFAWWDEADQVLRGRPVAKARQLWELEGPAESVPVEIAPPPPTLPTVDEPKLVEVCNDAPRSIAAMVPAQGSLF